MKNLAIVTLILGVFIFATSSCKKVEEPTALDVVAAAGTATIKGVAYATLDETETDQQYAPSGTKIIIELNANDFPGASTYGANSNMLLYTATVGAAGVYSVSVAAPKTAVTATIRPDDFSATYTDIFDEDWANTPFSAGTYSATVIDGSTTVVDIAY